MSRLEIPDDFRFYMRSAVNALNREKLAERLDRSFRKVALLAAGFATRLASARLRTRTGSLLRGMAGKAPRVDGWPAVQVGIYEGPSLQYAGPQNFGTKGKAPDSPYPTIRPRNAKALAVPTEEGGALTPAGVPRYASPRDYPEELVFLPFGEQSRAIGGLYDVGDLSEARDASGDVDLSRVHAVYLLLAKADLSPKRFLDDGLDQAFPQMGDAIADVLIEAVSGSAR